MVLSDEQETSSMATNKPLFAAVPYTRHKNKGVQKGSLPGRHPQYPRIIETGLPGTFQLRLAENQVK